MTLSLTEKARFSIDRNNRLRITDGSNSIAPAGSFSIGAAQRLIYTLHESPSWRKANGAIPSKLTFDGAWRLTPDYNLELIRTPFGGSARKELLVLRCNSLINKSDSLVFELIGSHGQQRDSLQSISLKGKWQADEQNRLVFYATGKPAASKIVLGGAWELNKNQQVVYSFEKADLKTKTKKTHELLFEGFWKIDSRNRLSYSLSGSTRSSFSFRAQLESPNLYPADNMIKYRIGIGLARQAGEKQKTISLYGVWKIGRRYSPVFEMQYAHGRIRRMEFGSRVSVNRNNEVMLALVSREHEPLGITLTYTRNFSKKLDARAFVRLRKSSRENAVEAGISFPF
ncbi:MAG: hypothetical protein WC695_03675 [Candidatus Omnitrophota bacterium]